MPHADTDRSFITGFAYCLLGIENQIQKNLHQLVRITHHQWKPLLTQEVHRDVALAQRISMQVQGTLHQFVGVSIAYSSRV